MDRYDWQSQLTEKVYATFPEASIKPVIGITGNYGDLTRKLAEGYYHPTSCRYGCYHQHIGKD